MWRIRAGSLEAPAQPQDPDRGHQGGGGSANVPWFCHFAQTPQSWQGEQGRGGRETGVMGILKAGSKVVLMGRREQAAQDSAPHDWTVGVSSLSLP